jgi:hypothetical protein
MLAYSLKAAPSNLTAEKRITRGSAIPESHVSLASSDGGRPPLPAAGLVAARITPTTSCNERHVLSSISLTHLNSTLLSVRHRQADHLARAQNLGSGPQRRLERGRIRRTWILGTQRPDTPGLSTQGCEPLGHTHELFSPGSSLHSFEHAAKRVSGGCRGVRELGFTHHAYAFTQLTLTHGTRDALLGVRSTRVRSTGNSFGRYAGHATTLGTQLTQRSLAWFRAAERNSVDNVRIEWGTLDLDLKARSASAVSRETSEATYPHGRFAASLAATLTPSRSASLGGSVCVPRMMTINRDTMATRRRKIGWLTKSS